ncbi:unnamed protein product [Amaranthus hypochondriacus]
MAQNQKQILMVVALIIVISANNIAQALDFDPVACTTLVNELKNDELIRQKLANNDPNGAMQLTMDHFNGNQCLKDFSELNQECLSQIANDFLDLVKNTNPEDFDITQEEVIATIDQGSELSGVCDPSA